MRKYWKWIIAILAVLLIGILIWFLIDYYSIPRLSAKEKDAVYNEWRKDMGEDYYWKVPFSWFDENGKVEEEGVLRYIGTYGDCYAFLRIGDNETATFNPVELPYKIRYLAYDVYYPIEAEVWLYHTQKEITYEFIGHEFKARLMDLPNMNAIGIREEWITDAQLEQLTRDIEKISNVEK